MQLDGEMNEQKGGIDDDGDGMTEKGKREVGEPLMVPFYSPFLHCALALVKVVCVHTHPHMHNIHLVHFTHKAHIHRYKHALSIFTPHSHSPIDIRLFLLRASHVADSAL